MDAWQTFEFYLPSSMPKAAVAVELRERVLIVAADRGDFVGPTRVGRLQREMTEMRTGTA